MAGAARPLRCQDRTPPAANGLHPPGRIRPGECRVPALASPGRSGSPAGQRPAKPTPHRPRAPSASSRRISRWPLCRRGLLGQVEQDPAQRDRLSPPAQVAPGRGVQVERRHQVAVPGAGSPVLGQQLRERHLDRDPELAIGIVVGPRRVDRAAEQRCARSSASTQRRWLTSRRSSSAASPAAAPGGRPHPTGPRTWRARCRGRSPGMWSGPCARPSWTDVIRPAGRDRL